MKYSYNYIFLSNNKKQFYKYNHKDLNGDLVVRFYDGLMIKANAFVKTLYRLHFSPRVNKFIKIPFKHIWNRWYFHEKMPNDKPICFVISCELYFLKKYKYFEFLRKKYQNCKLVFLFTDMVDYVSLRFEDFDIEYLRRVFDYVVTYEIYDVKKYKLTYFYNFLPPVFEKTFIDAEKTADVVFVGEAKDRLDTILDCYKFFISNGVICDFSIAFAPKEIRKLYPDINWIDEWISFEEVLTKIKHSKCILDIVQNNSFGLNARAIRAFQYNKFLISNCPSIRHCTLRDDFYVQYFDSISDIKVSHLKESPSPDYNFDSIQNALSSFTFFENLFNNNDSVDSFYLPLIDIKEIIKEI